MLGFIMILLKVKINGFIYLYENQLIRNKNCAYLNHKSENLFLFKAKLTWVDIIARYNDVIIQRLKKCSLFNLEIRNKWPQSQYKIHY